MKKIALIVFTCCLIIPGIAFADECSYQDKQRLQKLANNVTYTVEEGYNMLAEKDGTFIITFAGVSDELFFADSLSNLRVNYMDYNMGEFSVSNIDGGQTYQMRVYGRNTCEHTTIRTITINLPVLNIYYGDPICNDAREYSLCSKYNSTLISYEEFVYKVEEYKKNRVLNNNTNDNTSIEEPRWYQIYRKYYWPALISLIIVLGILIFLWIKEQKKNAL